MSYKAWFEKYRPITMDEVIFPNTDIKEVIESFYNNGFISGNILSYGPPGFGKTTVSEVLIHNVIKDRNDIFILGRKTTDVDELKKWLQQKPVHSKQKIVKIEEMDRLSSQAQIVLKDGLMEKYQATTTFLATTNNPEKLDPALLTRFNTKINFGELPKEGIKERLSFILKSENVVFSDEELEVFVNKYKKRGLRDLINNLELASHDGIFKPSRIDSFIGVSDSEDNIIQYIVYLMKYSESKSQEEVLGLLKNLKQDAHFWQYYEYIIKTFKMDLRINFDYIMDGLLDSDLDLMQQTIIRNAYQDLELKRFKSQHIIAMIADLLQNIYYQKGGLSKE